MAQVMSKAETASKSTSTASEKASTAEPRTQARKARSGVTDKAEPARAKTARAKTATTVPTAAKAKTATTAKRTAKVAATTTAAPKKARARTTQGKAAGEQPPPAKAATADGTPLSKTHARLSRKIRDEREKLVRQAEELEAERLALAADPDAAEMSGDIESGDCVASREREVDLRLSAHIEDMIAQIDRATERLQTGTYGACAQCHSRIPAARLEALPYAELCVACQEKQERLYY